MIHYLKRHQIAVNKYDNCIKHAVNSRIYAYSWYLDIVADNWDVLVLNDYEAVMPLPWRSKYFIKYIYPPAWTQQLGVFSEKEISSELILQFIKAIPKKFKKITIQFNSGNKFQYKNLTERVNYILPLNKSYEILYNSYRKDRKKRLRQFSNENIKILDTINFEELKKIFYSSYTTKFSIRSNSFYLLEKLISTLQEMDMIYLKSTKLDGNLISGAIFLKDRIRHTVLFSATSVVGLKLNAFTAIINQIIIENSNTNLILDFEGSMVKSIAYFNASFGAHKETYFLYQKPFGLF